MTSKFFHVNQTHHDLALKKNDFCTDEQYFQMYSVHNTVPSSLVYFAFASAAADDHQLLQFLDLFDYGLHLTLSMMVLLVSVWRGHLVCELATPLKQGCCSSPISHPSTDPSEQGPGGPLLPSELHSHILYCHNLGLSHFLCSEISVLGQGGPTK